MCTRINLPLFIIVDYRQPKYPFTFSSTKHYAGIKNNKHYLCKQVHKDIQNLTKGKKRILLKFDLVYCDLLLGPYILIYIDKVIHNFKATKSKVQNRAYSTITFI